MTGRVLRVATWNIHGGVGRDGRYDPQRIIAVLRELDADVVALQEVASLAVHGEFLRLVRDALGVQVVVGRTLTRRDAEFGNALLSRHPVTTNANIDLSITRREPRNAIDAHVAVDGMTLRVIATHLGLGPAERREQVRRILCAIESGADEPVALMGDLNEWYLWGRPLRWLHAHFSATPAPRTFPSGRPLLALDRIWMHPANALRNVFVHRTALSRAASDHLPLAGDVMLSTAR